MKVIVAGNWHSELHEEPVYKAFEALGHKPLRFQWHTYFKPGNFLERMLLPVLKAQYKYMLGPIVNRLNQDLVATVKREQPDIVFIYRGILIYKETLQRIKEAAPATVLVGYNNDDPFSPSYPKWKWRHFIAGVPEYDLMLAYRLHNLEDFRAAGAKRVELLRSWFIPEVNRPVELTAEEMGRFGCDVVFVGHYENDGRVAYLEEIVRRGWVLRIFGPSYEWDSVIARSPVLRKHIPVQLVWGRDYNNALCGAKIALCFFSKLNRDSYTRRCFEIPASGTVLMSEYSADLASLYRRNQEAVYFESVQEMSERLEWLFADDARRREIAAAGNHRVWADGHDVVSRMRAVLGWVNEIVRDSK